VFEALINRKIEAPQGFQRESEPQFHQTITLESSILPSKKSVEESTRCSGI
jgi:hypothetical protein